jgi:SAM-dependent methyltransferase
VDNATTIVDFGCGPGLYTTPLSEQGALVTGVDFSENSLNYAREVAAARALNIEYVRANYLDYETADRFDLIIMIMCDYCALSPVQRKGLLTKFKSLLNPDGRVLLDVYSLTMFDQKAESATYEMNQLDGFWSPDDYYCFLNSFKYEREKVLLDKYTIIEASRQRVVYNWLQCYSRDTLGEEFETAGFEVEDVFADVAGGAYTPDATEIAIIARKA